MYIPDDFSKVHDSGSGFITDVMEGIMHLCQPTPYDAGIKYLTSITTLKRAPGTNGLDEYPIMPNSICNTPPCSEVGDCYGGLSPISNYT